MLDLLIPERYFIIRCSKRLKHIATSAVRATFVQSPQNFTLSPKD